MVNNFNSDTLSCRLRYALARILPTACPVCSQSAYSANALCSSCEELVTNQTLDLRVSCLACALPLPSVLADERAESLRLYCPECQQSKPAFNRCIAAVTYSPITGKLVHLLKHSGQLNLIGTIERQMAHSIGPLYAQPVDLIVPVPLHPKRLAARGFNQSAEIAKRLSKKLRIPVDVSACRRLRDDPPQQSLNRANRQRNLINSFEFPHMLSGLRLAVVDDVVTTGATGNAIAKAALHKGAISVDIWCYARTPAPE